ncbi:unnamed protein product [Malus baccata var. baccata]
MRERERERVLIRREGERKGGGGEADHFPGSFHHRSTILSALGLPFAHGFVFGNSRATSQWVTHLGSALASFSLNFGVPTKPEANELPKSLVLGKDGNIHLRITPLGDVGCYNPPPLGARRPRRHTTTKIRL